MHPKFILFASADKPLAGTFVYGMTFQHKDLVKGYGKVHGGGWYQKDDKHKTMTLYGSSGDYGQPDFNFLNRIPSELAERLQGVPFRLLELERVLRETGKYFEQMTPREMAGFLLSGK